MLLIITIGICLSNISNAQIAKCSRPEDYSKEFFFSNGVYHKDETNPDTLKFYDAKKKLIGFSVTGNMNCVSMYFDNNKKLLGYTVIKGNTIYRFNNKNEKVGTLFISSVTLENYDAKGNLTGTTTTTYSNK
jgi:hypothetical protein